MSTHHGAAGQWRKSSRSGANGHCVEVASAVAGGRFVRDSKNPTAGPHHIPEPAFSAFLDAVKHDRFG